MGDTIRRFLVVMMSVNMAVTIIGLTGLFPIQIGVAGFDIYDSINSRIENTYNMFLNSSGWWDYTSLAITMITQGIVILFLFIGLVMFGLPLILYAVGVPMAVCAAITIPIGAVLYYEIANKFTRTV